MDIRTKVDQPESSKIVPFRLPDDRRPHASIPPLPTQLSGLFGRQAEVEQLVALIRHDDTRLVTITGPGGIGKTRLAIEAAAKISPDFAGSVGFVPLAHLQDPGLIGPAVATQLKIVRGSHGSLLDQIIGSIDSQPTLIIFDSFEHILPAAPFVIHLLTACPHLKIVVTSRARLNVRGEREFRVSTLETVAPPIEGAGSEIAPAVELFVARAKESNPSFTVSEARLNQIAEICRDLDGLPLAIELAAARSRVIPPEAMRPLIKRRLVFLTGGPRDAPKRQQTVRDTIRWTYDLLPAREQRLFRLLSIFPAGFTLDAAIMLAVEARYVESGDDPMLSLLSGTEILSDNSLLRSLPVSEGQPTDSRFVFYETIREFGLEQLAAHDELPIANEGLRLWCRSLSEHAASALRGAGFGVFDFLELEYPNVRAALTWLRDHDQASAGLEILQPLTWFMTQRYLLDEATGWAEVFLAMPDARADPAGYADALNGAAKIHYWYANFQTAIQHNEAALAIWRALGTTSRISETLKDLAGNVFDNGEIDRAETLIAEAVPLYEQAEDRLGRAVAISLLARIQIERHRLQEAIRIYQDALATFQSLGQQTWIAFAHEALGFALLLTGELPRARAEFERAIVMSKELGDRWRTACCLTYFGELARRDDELDCAAALFAAGERLRAEMGILQRPATQRVVAEWTQLVETSLSEERFQLASEAGRALSRDEAIAVALKRAEIVIVPRDGQPSRIDLVIAATGLTPREIEVLTLVCHGMGNREIAAQLFISHRTVMQHVANIFTKIDVSSRTAAAAWAHRNGIA